MKNLKSTNLQLIGFLGTKKPIICKIVDSVHSSVEVYELSGTFYSLRGWFLFVQFEIFQVRQEALGTRLIEQ